MPTELKPCPFCNTEPTVHRSLVEYKAEGKHPAGEYEESISISCHTCGYEMADEFREDISKKWNTRAVPDVPELVRYECELIGDFIDSYGMAEHSDDDYVQYDRAAAMLALREQQIKDLEGQLIDQHKELKVLKIKLAEYEKQKPIGVIHQGVFYSTKDLEEYPEYSTGIEIYASPAPKKEKDTDG